MHLPGTHAHAIMTLLVRAAGCKMIRHDDYTDCGLSSASSTSAYTLADLDETNECIAAFHAGTEDAAPGSECRTDYLKYLHASGCHQCEDALDAHLEASRACNDLAAGETTCIGKTVGAPCGAAPQLAASANPITRAAAIAQLPHLDIACWGTLNRTRHGPCCRSLALASAWRAVHSCMPSA